MDKTQAHSSQQHTSGSLAGYSSGSGCSMIEIHHMICIQCEAASAVGNAPMSASMV
jgi:hypothetical protein